MDGDNNGQNETLFQNADIRDSFYETMKKYKTIDELMEYINGIEIKDSDLDNFDIEDGKLLHYLGDEEIVYVPKSVTVIGHRAFSRNNHIRAVYLGDNVTAIESDAFNECINLEVFIMSDNVEYIGESAFELCARLKYIYLSKNLEIIKESLFEGCVNLKDISMPPRLTIIEEAAFSYTGLIHVRIPEFVSYIGMFAFEGCEKLTRVYLPDGLKVIEEQVFSACPKLVYVDIPNSVTKIKAYAFEGSGLPVVKLPDDLIFLESSAFKNCCNLTKVKTFRDYIFFKKQNQRIFENCFSLFDDEEIQDKMYHAYKCLDMGNQALFVKKYDTAYKLFLEAAKANYGPAYAALAYFELLGSNGEINQTKALEYFKKGAEVNNPACLYNLACFYVSGEGGVEVNYELALKLARKAAEYGYGNAEELVVSIKCAKIFA